MGGVLTGKHLDIAGIIIVKIYMFIQPLRSDIVMLVHRVHEIVFVRVFVVKIPGCRVAVGRYIRSCGTDQADKRIAFVYGLFKCGIALEEVRALRLPLLVANTQKSKIKWFRMSHFFPYCAPFCIRTSVCKFNQVKRILY